MLYFVWLLQCDFLYVSPGITVTCVGFKLMVLSYCYLLLKCTAPRKEFSSESTLSSVNQTFCYWNIEHCSFLLFNTCVTVHFLQDTAVYCFPSFDASLHPCLLT